MNTTTPMLAFETQPELARALTDIQFSKIGNRLIAEKLRTLRDYIWKAAHSPHDHASSEQAFKAALDGLSNEEIQQFCASYARMGSLYELAGLTARDNYFTRLSQKHEPIPGGVELFVKEQKSCKEALTKLGMPVFEPVLTMHPTSVTSLQSMQALRKIALALREGSRTKIDEAIDEYEKQPVIHAPLSVRGETKTVLNFLHNIYDDLPLVFKQYDTPLAKHFSDYNKLGLKLNTRLASWGSAGDKDGNPNVTSEKTLEAIARHTFDIVDRYIADLDAINNPALQERREALDYARHYLRQLLKDAEQLSDDTDRLRDPKIAKGDPAELSREFDDISKALASVRKTLDAEAFKKDLVASYRKSSGEQAEKTLSLIRRVRWFGFEFSKIEYREKASEYTKAIGEIIPGYGALSPARRSAMLTELLNRDELPPEITKKIAAIAAEGAGKHLSDTSDHKAVAYHAIRRIQLASDFGDMIKDNVLAECGIVDAKDPKYEDVVAQGLSNMLEAQFLQRAVEDKSRGRAPARLGIVPLFEDPSTMRNVEHIMRAVYSNPAYVAHLQMLAADRHDGKPTQQVQMAHSDNRRRAGALAGTAFIHEAHRKLRALNDAFGIRSQFYQGGSLSDPFRNGVRSITAQVNAYGMHDFAKFTFQGGDMLNYFNHPGSNERIFTRHFVHPASRAQQNDRGEWFIGRGGNEEEVYKNGIKRDHRPNMVIEEVACEALKMTLSDYQKNDFTKQALGTLYAALGVSYEREAGAASKGSRPKSRLSFGKSENTQLGAIVAMDPENVRTISFSGFPQQNNLVTTPVGGLLLNKYIEKAIRNRLDAIREKNIIGYEMPPEEDFFIKHFADVGAKGVQPNHMALLYDKSPAFRDAMDKCAFAVAKSDLEMVARDVVPKFEAQQDGEIRQRGLTYVDRLKDTFKSVGNIVYEALLGEPEKHTSYNQPLGANRMRFALVEKSPYLRHGDSENAGVQAAAMEALNGLGQEMVLKNQYQDFICYTKNALEKAGKLDDDTLTTLLAGGLTVTHGRWGADDPALAEHQRRSAGYDLAV